MIVKQYLAILFGAAFVHQEVEHALSDLRRERLVEMLLLRQGAQQTLSVPAVWIETLGDVNVERDGVLLVLQAQALHNAKNMRSWVILPTLVVIELITVGRPQGLQAALVWRGVIFFKHESERG